MADDSEETSDRAHEEADIDTSETDEVSESAKGTPDGENEPVAVDFSVDDSDGEQTFEHSVDTGQYEEISDPPPGEMQDESDEVGIEAGDTDANLDEETPPTDSAFGDDPAETQVDFEESDGSSPPETFEDESIELGGGNESAPTAEEAWTDGKAPPETPPGGTEHPDDLHDAAADTQVPDSGNFDGEPDETQANFDDPEERTWEEPPSSEPPVEPEAPPTAENQVEDHVGTFEEPAESELGDVSTDADVGELAEGTPVGEEAPKPIEGEPIDDEFGEATSVDEEFDGAVEGESIDEESDEPVDEAPVGEASPEPVEGEFEAPDASDPADSELGDVSTEADTPESVEGTPVEGEPVASTEHTPEREGSGDVAMEAEAETLEEESTDEAPSFVLQNELDALRDPPESDPVECEPLPDPDDRGEPATLVVYREGEEIESYVLDDDRYVLGRSDPDHADAETPDIDLAETADDLPIWCQHLAVYRYDHDYTVCVTSDSDTQWNDERLELGERRRLEDGDLLILGGELGLQFERA